MQRSKRSFLASAALTPLALVEPAIGSSNVTRVGGLAFGSSWRVSFANKHVTQDQVRAIIDHIVSQVDRAMSPYRADSALSRFNATRSTQWQAMPGALRAVLDCGLRIAKMTGGAFDPAVGPLVGQFGFGPIRAKPAGHFGDIVVGQDAIRKSNPGLCLDLCAIAKGYALDQIGDALREIGITDHMIELGGELRASGRHPSGRPWQAGIERPGQGVVNIQRVVRLDSMALATSADTANYYELGGKRFSHLIDPKQQRPIDHGLSSVSVMAPSAMMADGLATALIVMGPIRGVALARAARFSAYFVSRRGAQYQETMTGDFSSRIVA